MVREQQHPGRGSVEGERAGYKLQHAAVYSVLAPAAHLESTLLRTHAANTTTRLSGAVVMGSHCERERAFVSPLPRLRSPRTMRVAHTVCLPRPTRAGTEESFYKSMLSGETVGMDPALLQQPHSAMSPFTIQETRAANAGMMQRMRKCSLSEHALYTSTLVRSSAFTHI